MKSIVITLIIFIKCSTAFGQCRPAFFKQNKQAAIKSGYLFYLTTNPNLPISVSMASGTSTNNIIYNIWMDTAWVSLPETNFEMNNYYWASAPKVIKWNNRIFAFCNSLSGFNSVKAPPKKIFTFLELKNGAWDTLSGATFDSTFASTFTDAVANDKGLYFQTRSLTGESALFKYDNSIQKFVKKFVMNDSNGYMALYPGKNRLIVSSAYKTINDSMYGLAYFENDSLKVFRDSFFNMNTTVGIDVTNDHFYAFQQIDNPIIREYSNKLIGSRATYLDYDQRNFSSLMYSRIIDGKIVWRISDINGTDFKIFVLCPGETQWKTTILNMFEWGNQIATSKSDFYISNTKQKRSFVLQNGSLVKGTAFVDLDSSCTFNSSKDFKLKNHLIKAHSLTQDYTVSALTDPSGGFELYVAKDTFRLIGPGKSPKCFSDTAIVVADTLVKNVASKRPGFKDLKVNLNSGFTIRWNGNAYFQGEIENLGEPSDSAHFEFKQDPKIKIISVDSNTAFFNDSIAKGVVKKLEYFDKRIIRILSWVDTSQTKPDSIVCHQFSAYLFDNEKDSTNNNNNQCQKVVYSRDPNYKECSKKEIGVNESAMLDYYIEFQNEGNDDALDVVIEDILSTQLNIETLQIIGTSHPYTYSVAGRELKIVFNNIGLKPKKSNELLSKGFVKLRIMTVKELKDQDSILNQAAIYFDLNSPVITNTSVVKVTSKVASIQSQLTNFKGLLVYPNPSNNDITIASALNEPIYIYNQNGKLMGRYTAEDGKLFVHIGSWSDGLYIVKCGQQNFKFIKASY